MTGPELIAAAGGMVGVIGAWVAWAKTKAEADQVAVETMRDVLEEVRAELVTERTHRGRCETRLETMAAEIRSVRMQLVRTENQVQNWVEKVAVLETWVRAQGHNPDIIDGYPRSLG